MNARKSVGLFSFIGERESILIQAFWITTFAALTAIGAQLQIPHQPVPYTLQTFFVLLSGALLGKRNGAISQFLYLAAGATGLPVFSGFGFGVARLLSPTGGYLLSFPIAAFVVGYLINQRNNLMRTIIAMGLGLFIIFSLGTLQLNGLYVHNWLEAFSGGFLIFSWWDILKLSAAVAIYRAISYRAIKDNTHR